MSKSKTMLPSQKETNEGRPLHLQMLHRKHELAPRRRGQCGEMRCLKIKHNPCQTQAVAIESLLCAREIRSSLGAPAVDHYCSIIKRFLGEKNHVGVQREFRAKLPWE